MRGRPGQQPELGPRIRRRRGRDGPTCASESRPAAAPGGSPSRSLESPGGLQRRPARPDRRACVTDAIHTAAVDPKTGFLARASDSPKSALDGPPKWVNDGAVTPDGFAVNTVQPAYPPYSSQSQLLERLPPQTMPTIGDRLSEKKISWAWYSGGWNQAVLGKIESYEGPDYFQPHHQPFNYFAAFAPGTRARAEHLQDLEDLKGAIALGNLPAVAFYKPVGRDNEHPGYTNLSTGDAHVAELIRLVQQSRNWNDTAIIVTADENGGSWNRFRLRMAIAGGRACACRP